ncbi:homocysteine S-methyltransferase family protein [Tropicimonas sp. S265A]|uniref:homocysteine S-methyltransferase family protein n=1 Tax=Tropicimonas sp. S265A TaxID=3415134 RepID=UPI003C7D1A37
MSRYTNLMTRLRGGARILIDGGTGTEVERRGVPQVGSAWSSSGTLSHPGIVRQIHEDYIAHGAEIIITNTFSTARNTLADAGAEDQFEVYNRRATELAIEARDAQNAPDVLVAGGISYWSFVARHPPLDVLAEGIAAQAAIIAGAGADFLMLEMQVHIDRMLVTLEAAQSSGIPVWVGLSCVRDETGTVRLYKGGEKLSDALDALADRNVPVVNIMHTDVRDIDACLDVVAAHWNGMVGVYAHSGAFVDGKWIFEDTISPGDYATASAGWLERGVQILGGCCGIRPDHMEAVRGVV